MNRIPCNALVIGLTCFVEPLNGLSELFQVCRTVQNLAGGKSYPTQHRRWDVHSTAPSIFFHIARNIG